jgi:hypothetical protein
MLIRSARASDLNQLLQLSAVLPPGMTSMPFDKSTWEKKLAVVEESLMDSPNPMLSESICWSWKIPTRAYRRYGRGRGGGWANPPVLQL